MLRDETVLMEIRRSYNSTRRFQSPTFEIPTFSQTPLPVTPFFESTFTIGLSRICITNIY